MGNRPRGRPSQQCPTCHKPPSRCRCYRTRTTTAPVAPPLPAAPPAPPPATVTAPAAAPALPPTAPAPGGGAVTAFRATAIGEAALTVDPSACTPEVYQTPGPPTAPPPPAAALAPVPPERLAAAVDDAAGPPPAPPTALEERAAKAERVAYTAEEIAQLRAIAVTVTQGVFFLNNWALGHYYYKMDVLDMPPPVPQHVAAGADLLQPVITRMIGTHTTLGAVAAFGAVLGQHNVALARSIAKTRATAVQQTAAEETRLERAAAPARAPAAPAPRAPAPPPTPPSEGIGESMRFEAIQPDSKASAA